MKIFKLISSGEEICCIDKKSNPKSKNITVGKSVSEVVKSKFSHLIILIESFWLLQKQKLSVDFVLVADTEQYREHIAVYLNEHCIMFREYMPLR